MRAQFFFLLAKKNARDFFFSHCVPNTLLSPLIQRYVNFYFQNMYVYVNT
jgi:hypothetical protein